MSNKYLNKYRIPSARLQSWDYSNNGAYFITICTKSRKHYFGKILKGEMQLSDIGKLAVQFWLEIPNHFQSVELGNFVVMPNHVHGILIINSNLRSQKEQFSASTISTMVGSYKSIVTKMSRQKNTDFGWQSRFHDHIIRNSESYERIQNYIENNPANWKEDAFFSML
ncbi:transposase [Flavobacterium qiangtangense]|uniref:Transposase n=1 Tax=Flavobacterium qiangtangense TaxID=1442595 RepID=A0ABW1PN55_9FLAO